MHDATTKSAVATIILRQPDPMSLYTNYTQNYAYGQWSKFQKIYYSYLNKGSKDQVDNESR